MNPNPDLSVMFLLVIAAMNIFLAAMASKVYMMTNRRIYLVLVVLFIVTVPQAVTLAYMRALGLNFHTDPVGVSTMALYASLFAVFSVYLVRQSTVLTAIGVAVSVGLFIALAIPLKIKPYWLAATGVISHLDERDLLASQEGQIPAGFVTPVEVSLLREPWKIALIEEIAREEEIKVVYTDRFTDTSGGIDWEGVILLKFDVWVSPDQVDEFLEHLSGLKNSEIPLPPPGPHFYFQPENA